ncbi:MAG: hypothetical protein RLZZ507_4476 [Cyanobacteriota bacterium]
MSLESIVPHGVSIVEDVVMFPSPCGEMSLERQSANLVMISLVFPSPCGEMSLESWKGRDRSCCHVSIPLRGNEFGKLKFET